MYFLYILKCKDGSLYTGITTDVMRRFEEHKKGIGGHYTSTHPAVKILYTETCSDRSSALKREAHIKSLRREQKIALYSS